MSQEGYEDIWKAVESQTGLKKEDFEKKVKSVLEAMGNLIQPRAAAMIVAKDLGVDITQVIIPAITGRVIEVGPVRKSSGREETRFCIFVVVNEKERIPCVAFGDEHVNLVRNSDDKVVKITNYTIATLKERDLVRVTESSKIEILNDNELPSILKLEKAWAPNLKYIMEERGVYIIKAAIIEEDVTEYQACPICKKRLDFVEMNWVCQEHGVVDPEVRKINRYQIADTSGIYSAVYFGQPPQDSLYKKIVIMKGYFKDNEFQISKFYEIKEPKIEEN